MKAKKTWREKLAADNNLPMVKGMRVAAPSVIFY
jgi:hypothetical protein